MFAVVMSVGLLGIATPAVADSGVRTLFEDELSGQHFLSGPCGMPIMQEGVLRGHVITYANGVEHVHVQVDLTLTANGRTARERPSFNVTVDPAAATVTTRGTVINVHAEGSGQLLKDVGRTVRDLGTGDIVELAGRWDVLDGDFDRVCSYFAGT